MRRSLALGVLLSVLGATSASAQVSSVTGPVAEVPAALRRQAVDSMSNDLLRMVTIMEVYFTDAGTYVGQLSKTDRTKIRVVPAAGVTLSLLYATREAWVIRANHDWLPASSCVIYVGAVPPSRMPKTSAEGRAPGEEGAPVCDSR